LLDKFNIFKNFGFSINKWARSLIPKLDILFSDILRSCKLDFFKYLKSKAVHLYPKWLQDTSN